MSEEKGEKAKFNPEGGWSYETDLDDTSDEGGRYEAKKGDELIVIVEDLELFEGPQAPYASVTARILGGPIGDPERNAGPFRGEDGEVFSLRMWDNLSLSPKAKFRLKPFLRACGHSGKLVLTAPKTDDDPTPEEQLQDICCDRELRIKVKMEKDQNSDTYRPRPDTYEPLAPADWKLVEHVYTDFGPARGMGWTEKPVSPIVPWEGIPKGVLPPEKPQAPAATASAPAPGRGGRRAASEAAAPAAAAESGPVKGSDIPY